MLYYACNGRQALIYSFSVGRTVIRINFCCFCGVMDRSSWFTMIVTRSVITLIRRTPLNHESKTIQDSQITFNSE